MAITIVPNTISVVHEELSDPAPSPVENYNDGGFTASRTLKCAWDKRSKLAQQLKGGVSTSDQGAQVFVLAHRYPHNDVGALCRGVAIAPFGEPVPNSANSTMGWSHALLTATYETDDTTDSGGGSPDSPTTLVREQLTGYSQTLNLPSTLFWNALAAGVQENPLPAGAAPAKHMRGLTWAYTWLALDTIPSAFISQIGTCNASAVVSDRFGVTFAAQTLLYGEPQISIITSSDGSVAKQATLPFTFQPHTWNKFFGKPGVEDVANLLYKQGSATAYEPVATSDFANLLTLG